MITNGSSTTSGRDDVAAARADPAVGETRRQHRICHITTAHPTFDIRIFHKECRSLADAGYEVVLLAPHDRGEVRDGVRIEPLPKKGRTWSIPRAALRRALEIDADLYHLHDPPEGLLVAMLLKLRGRRVVFDAHEDFPGQILGKRWLPAWLRRPLSWVAEAQDALARTMLDGFVTATPTIAERYPGARTRAVQNFPILDELAIEESEPFAERPRQVVYAGGITRMRGAVEMVDALERVADARLQLAGPVQESGLEQTLEARPGWAQVDYLGVLERPELARLLGRARAGLVLFHPARNHCNSQPNKLFEYMSAGLPVIASDFPLWREVIEAAGSGINVDPRDKGAIAEAISWILEHPEEAEAMGRKGQVAVRERFNWAAESEGLLAHYEQLLSNG